MLVLSVLSAAVACKSIVSDRLSLFLSGHKNGNQIVSMTKSIKTEPVDFIHWS